MTRYGNARFDADGPGVWGIVILAPLRDMGIANTLRLKKKTSTAPCHSNDDPDVQNKDGYWADPEGAFKAVAHELG